MTSNNVLCSSCSQRINNSPSDIYSIIKCGHVYHGQCLRKIIYKKTCSICHIRYDPRQCCKLNIFPTSKLQCENDQMSIFKCDWMYFDEKTDLKEDELSKFMLKLGTDPNNDNKDIYAARVFYRKHIIPAYFIPPKSAIAIYGDYVYDVSEDIELLDISSDDPDFYEWVKCTHDQVPENGLDITELSNESILIDADINVSSKFEGKQYLARGEYEGKILYGKLCSKDNGEGNCVYLANGKQVIKRNRISEVNCEVLVRNAQKNFRS